MWKSVAVWACILCCGGCGSKKDTKVRQLGRVVSEFPATATVIEAIEGGPLVIKVAMKYCGEHPRNVTPSSMYPSKFFEGTPEKWGDGLEVGIVWSGLHSRDGIPSYQRINPGDEWTRLYYLHHRYRNISPERIKLKIKWTVCSDTPAGAIIAHPEVPLEFDIQPANAEHLAALCERLECRLDIASRSVNAGAIEEVLKYIEGTKHSALVPLAWRLIRQNPAYGRIPGMWFVAQYSEDLQDADLRLTRLVSELDLLELQNLIRCWAHRETPISSDAFYLLNNSPRLWDRLLTYIYFSKRCDQRWVCKLLTDLPSLTQPVSHDRFIRLLRDVDDDQFTVREAATTQLTAYGERVETQLTDSLKAPISPEAKRRVRLILDRIATAKEAPEWKPIVEHLSLGDCDRDAAIAVLRALAKGNPDAALTKAAVASLNKLTAHK